MLNALARGKYKLRSELKEDTLTSSVLDYLLLLPDSMIWEILRNSNPKNSELPKQLGRLLDVEFWPNWNTKEIPEVNNTRYIEPDVFIEFQFADVIIEAKRYDDNQQSENQWRDQIKVYKENIGNDDDSKKLIYIALGGIRSSDKENIVVNKDSHYVYKLQWKQLMEIITGYTKAIEQTVEILPNSSSYLRILQTILSALELHGYYMSNHVWLNTINHTHKSLNNSLKNISLWNPQTI